MEWEEVGGTDTSRQTRGRNNSNSNSNSGPLVTHERAGKRAARFDWRPRNLGRSQCWGQIRHDGASRWRTNGRRAAGDKKEGGQSQDYEECNPRTEPLFQAGDRQRWTRTRTRPAERGPAPRSGMRQAVSPSSVDRLRRRVVPHLFSVSQKVSERPGNGDKVRMEAELNKRPDRRLASGWGVPPSPALPPAPCLC